MNASTLQKSWKWYSSEGFILRNKNVWASETFVHHTAYILQYFKLGKKKKKILLHFVWGTGGVTLTIGLAYKNLHPRCTPLTGIKVASIVSSNSEGVFPKCQTRPLISPVFCFQSFSTATLDARPTPFPSSWLFYRGSAGRLVVFTAFWDRLPSLSSF